MIKITLDTNCIINYFDTDSQTATSTEEILNLLRYATAGRIGAVITTRAEADIDQDKNEQRRSFMKKVLGIFEVIGSVIRLNESVLSGGDFLSDQKIAGTADEIQKIIFPGLTEESKRRGNMLRDVDHIMAHIISERDIFVTDDKRINQCKGELKRFGAVIMRPAECLSYIADAEERAKFKIPVASQAEGYLNKALCGIASFNYSNNNGRFTIGSGYFTFETSWTKASDISIHAYSNAPSIMHLALAKNAKNINEIRNASIYDYSSEFRTVRIDEIILWRNTNGLYAATKILAVSDDTRGTENDELAFEFRVLVSGNSFSQD